MFVFHSRKKVLAIVGGQQIPTIANVANILPMAANDCQRLHKY
jgi:hypothetical protein